MIAHSRFRRVFHFFFFFILTHRPSKSPRKSIPHLFIAEPRTLKNKMYIVMIKQIPNTNSISGIKPPSFFEVYLCGLNVIITVKLTYPWLLIDPSQVNQRKCDILIYSIMLPIASYTKDSVK